MCKAAYNPFNDVARIGPWSFAPRIPEEPRGQAMAQVVDYEQVIREVADEIEAMNLPIAAPPSWERLEKGGPVTRPLDLASFIEHTALKPETTTADVAQLCAQANRFGFRAVCVNPVFVAEAKGRLAGTKCAVVSVVGFPLGANLKETKVRETQSVIEQGADEVDMVCWIGALKGHDYRAVYEDVGAVVAGARPHPVKVILETALLEPAEKVAACMLSVRAGAAFVKTSTGFGGRGATVEDVELMRRVVGHGIGIKAAGGIRDYGFARALIHAGANRLGCSASVAIVTGSPG